MKTIPNLKMRIDDARPPSVPVRSPVLLAGDRPKAGPEAPGAKDPFSGRVIRIGLARVPSRRLNLPGN